MMDNFNGYNLLGRFIGSGTRWEKINGFGYETSRGSSGCGRRGKVKRVK